MSLPGVGAIVTIRCAGCSEDRGGHDSRQQRFAVSHPEWNHSWQPTTVRYIREDLAGFSVERFEAGPDGR